VARRAGIPELTVNTLMEVRMSKPLAALVLAAVPLAANAAPESYTVDPYHTFPNFTIERAVSVMHGRFNRTSGKATLDRAAKSASVELVIEASSVDTGDGDKGSRPRSRDEHLRSADFFNAAEFPRITFKSTSVAFAGDNPSAIDGNFTMLGVTKPVNLTLERFKCIPATVNAKERCGGNAIGRIKRSDFGMKFGIPNLGDEVALNIEFEMLKD
jgi:polyisoprenoid-binding protein YceI